MSTGSSVSERTRESSWSERAGMTTLVSSTGSSTVDRLDGDAVVVGRGESQLVALELGQDTGQDRSGLVRGSGERHLAEGLPQDVLGHPGRRPLAGRRNGRELLGVDTLDTRLEPPGLDVQRLLGLELEIDPLVGRQPGDDVGQQPGRHGHRAAGIDLARHPVRHPDLEIGGGQLEAAVLGSEQDVVQDRKRAPGRDGAADDLETAGQVLLHDREFHVGFTPLRSGQGRRQDRSR